jgi:4'-phosphopantetheinyl transferase
MKINIGKRKDYSSFELIQKAYRIRYDETISQDVVLRHQSGKPYFRNSTMQCFNISHFGDYVACVFDEDEVGLDIQKIRRTPEKVLKLYLHTKSEDPVQQTMEWTKFESYGKLKGTGIPSEDDYARGVFKSSAEQDGYIVTVCTKNEKDQAIELVYI